MATHPAPDARPAPETMTLQEVWTAAGGNPGIKPTRADVLEALRQLDEVCDEAAARPAPPAADGGWVELPYATPWALCRAFKGGAKFTLHYHGKIYPVTSMEPRGNIVLVTPPGMPVKVFPNGRSDEGLSPDIWLAATPSAADAAPAASEPASGAVQAREAAMFRAIVRHWNEFGHEHGFGELMDNAYALSSTAGATVMEAAPSHRCAGCDVANGCPEFCRCCTPSTCRGAPGECAHNGACMYACTAVAAPAVPAASEPTRPTVCSGHTPCGDDSREWCRVCPKHDRAGGAQP